MRTIVLGLAFVLAWYGLQAWLVAHWLGPLAAGLWLVVLAVAGRLDFALRDRRLRAWRRARTFLALRADPELRRDALREAHALVADGLALEQALTGPPPAAG